MDQHENQGREGKWEKKNKGSSAPKQKSVGHTRRLEMEKAANAKPEVCWPYMPPRNGRAAESIQTPSQKSQFGIPGVPHALCKHSEIIISSWF